ncbi:MAG: DUF3313 family protein [Pseudomonadota bacterium]
MRTSFQSAFALAACLFTAGLAVAQDEWPQTTHDGLELQDTDSTAVVYWRPGATLQGYTKVYLVEAPVAFKKNWKRNQNTSTMGIGNKVTSSDMEKIKQTLSEEFRRVFVEELESDGRLEVVDELGEDVVVIKPAIINLDVAAPDVRNTERNVSMVTSAGEMTLYLEFYDAVTGEIFGRVLDRKVDDKFNFAMQANRVSNKRDADKILKAWASALREHIGKLD